MNAAANPDYLYSALESLISEYFGSNNPKNEQKINFCITLINSSAFQNNIWDENEQKLKCLSLVLDSNTGLFKDNAQQRFETLWNEFYKLSVIAKKSNILQVLISIHELLKENNLLNPIFSKNVPNSAIKSTPKIPIVRINSPIQDNKLKIYNLQEYSVIRDLIFTFQGIDGKNILYSKLDNSYFLSQSLEISDGLKCLVYQMIEIGNCHNMVTNFLKKINESNKINGPVIKSIGFALSSELNGFYKILASIDSSHNHADNPLTMKQLYCIITPSMEKIKWLAIICESLEMSKGCALIGVLNSLELHGTPIAKEIIRKIKRDAIGTILCMIKQWVIEGNLTKSGGDFFVEANVETKDEDMWFEKYFLIDEAIPSFLTYKQAKTIYLTGKTINFLKFCCKEESWIIESDMQNMNNFDSENEFPNQYFYEWIELTKDKTCKYFLQIIFEKFHLNKHLSMMQKYFLLGQGDFFQYLIDLLSEELSKPHFELYRHKVLEILGQAIRGSNSQFCSPDILSSLDISLLPGNHDDKGWDIFCMDYRISNPISTVLNQKVVSSYKKIFSFLWKLRQTHYTITKSWIYESETNKIPPEKNKLFLKLHQLSIVRNEMQDIISNLLNYIMVEVLESNWKIFLDDLKIAQDFDEIISYQNTLISNIYEKGLLNPQHNELYQLLQILQRIILKYGPLLTSFFKSFLEIYLNKKKSSKKEKDSIEIGMEDLKETEISWMGQLDNLQHDFQENMKKFNEVLLKEEYRMLNFRIDFNEYYSLQSLNRKDNLIASNLSLNLNYPKEKDPKANKNVRKKAIKPNNILPEQRQSNKEDALTESNKLLQIVEEGRDIKDEAKEKINKKDYTLANDNVTENNTNFAPPENYMLEDFKRNDEQEENKNNENVQNQEKIEIEKIKKNEEKK